MSESTSRQHFLLVLEPEDTRRSKNGGPADREPAAASQLTEAGECGAARWDRLAVPSGLSTLTITKGGKPRISVARTRARGSASCLLEPVRRQDRDQLLLTHRSGPIPRLNGLPAPKIGVLEIRDQLRLEGGPLLHVSAEVPSGLQAPAPDQVGQECPVCRVPLTAETRVYVCAHCLTATHDEPEEVPAEDRLECTRLTDSCSTCGRPIQREGGLLYLPED